jgi:hypothetical protein
MITHIHSLHKEISDLKTALDIAFSPFESGRRASLPRSERKAEEKAIVRLVERAELVSAELASADLILLAKASAALGTKNQAARASRLLDNTRQEFLSK